MRVRSKDQYRVWFESGIGVCIYLGRGTPEISFLDFGMDENDDPDHPPGAPYRPRIREPDRAGLLRGGQRLRLRDAGRGRSFDGRPKSRTTSALPLNHMGMPTQQKRFFRSDLHLDLESQIHVSVAALFNDGSNPDATGGRGGDRRAAAGSGTRRSVDRLLLGIVRLNGFHVFDMPGLGRNASILIQGAHRRWSPRTRIQRDFRPLGAEEVGQVENGQRLLFRSVHRPDARFGDRGADRRVAGTGSSPPSTSCRACGRSWKTGSRRSRPPPPTGSPTPSPWTPRRRPTPTAWR